MRLPVDNMVIGITGHPAAGKDSVAEYLGTQGFAHISMGDFLREEMRKKNIPTDRSHVHEFVKAMRAERGNGYPAAELAEHVQGNTAISGFRNLAEVEIFRKKFSKAFFLIAVEASAEIRYARISERKRVGDNISFEKFKEEEDAERAQASGAHEVDKVIAAADITVQNNSTKEDFFTKLEEVLRTYPIHD